MHLRHPSRVLIGVLLGAAAACAPPERPAECIAPANAGGGWDLTCRAVARTMGELGLVRGAMRVTNVPGAGGAIAFAHATVERKGDGNVLVAASPATTLRLAQGQFGDFTEGDVRWVGAIAADYGVIAVRPDAPWRSLDGLIEAWRGNPARVVVGGGSAAGGQDHMKILVLARNAGLDPLRVRYVPFDGGGEAMTALLGGFIQVFSGDATEARAQVDAGALRVLAVFAPERLAAP
jgi:putative tricarboxylic transport membrane protein